MNEISELRKKYLNLIDSAETDSELEDVRISALGKKGEMIKKIREDSQKKMSQILKAKIHLYLEILNA